MQRLARIEDLPALKSIWASSFPEDTPADIDAFFTRQFRESECLLYEEKGSPVSMVFMLPAFLRTSGTAYPVQYIYAASTLPAFRGQGLFGSLLRRAHVLAAERGQTASFLRPGEPSLFSYYRQFGYRDWFTVWEETYSRGQLVSGPGETTELQTVSGKAYHIKRRRFLESYPAWIDWGERLIGQAVHDAADRRGGVLCADDGCLLYSYEGDALRVEELLCPPERTSSYLRAVARQFPARVYAVRRPAFPPGEGTAFGMWRPLCRETEALAGGAYMGITLE